MPQIADRITWAVEMLNIQPDDQILEIGCGHGAAVDLICNQLTTGRITAIDRSARMIETAQKRNQVHIEAGTALLQTASLENATFKGAKFNKIFAINVSLFWMQPAPTLKLIDQHLAPNGILYIVHQPPVQEKTHEVADQLRDSLPLNGFQVRETHFKETKSIQITCVIAERSSDARI